MIDSLCGLFIVTLGMGLYLQTNRIVNNNLSSSNQRVHHERQIYEKNISKN